jgi:hypothetical protein
VLLELESLFSKNDTVLDVQDVMRVWKPFVCANVFCSALYVSLYLTLQMAAEIQQHCSQQALASKEIIKGLICNHAADPQPSNTCLIAEMTNRIASKEKEIIAPSEVRVLVFLHSTWNSHVLDKQDEHKTRVCVMLDEKLDIHTQIEDLRRAINDTRARTTQVSLYLPQSHRA